MDLRHTAIVRMLPCLALALGLGAAGSGCSDAYHASASGIDTRLAGVAVVDQGIQLDFAEGLSLVLRFDGMTCAGDSTASCVRSFAPGPNDPRPTCAIGETQVVCTSPGGEATATADGTFRIHVHRATGDLVIEGSFDRTARSGSFHYAATGACSCEASGTFSVR